MAEAPSVKEAPSAAAKPKPKAADAEYEKKRAEIMARVAAARAAQEAAAAKKSIAESEERPVDVRASWV